MSYTKEDIAEALSMLDTKRARDRKAVENYLRYETCCEAKPPLFGATPGCTGKAVPQNCGGVRCDKCGGWFCY